MQIAKCKFGRDDGRGTAFAFGILQFAFCNLHFAILRTDSMFTRAETDWCCRLVELAREEDLEPAGDLTSLAVLPAGLEGQATFVARAEGILAGLPAATIALAAIDCRLQVEALVQDGIAL